MFPLYIKKPLVVDDNAQRVFIADQVPNQSISGGGLLNRSSLRISGAVSVNSNAVPVGLPYDPNLEVGDLVTVGALNVNL